MSFSGNIPPIVPGTPTPAQPKTPQQPPKSTQEQKVAEKVFPIPLHGAEGKKRSYEEIKAGSDHQEIDFERLPKDHQDSKANFGFSGLIGGLVRKIGTLFQNLFGVKSSPSELNSQSHLGMFANPLAKIESGSERLTPKEPVYAEIDKTLPSKTSLPPPLPPRIRGKGEEDTYDHIQHLKAGDEEPIYEDPDKIYGSNLDRKSGSVYEEMTGINQPPPSNRTSTSGYETLELVDKEPIYDTIPGDDTPSSQRENPYDTLTERNSNPNTYEHVTPDPSRASSSNEKVYDTLKRPPPSLDAPNSEIKPARPEYMQPNSLYESVDDIPPPLPPPRRPAKPDEGIYEDLRLGADLTREKLGEVMKKKLKRPPV